MLEVPGGRQVAGLLLLARERVVRDPLDEGLEKGVVATLGRARVGLERQQVLAHERCEDGLQRLLVHPGQGSQAGLREGLAEHGGVFDHPPLHLLEAVEPRGDQRVQGLRHLERLDLSVGHVDVALAAQQPAVEQHAHGLHGVEGHALGPLADAHAELLREARHEPVEQLVDRVVRERLERDRREVALGRAPAPVSLP